MSDDEAAERHWSRHTKKAQRIIIEGCVLGVRTHVAALPVRWALAVLETVTGELRAKYHQSLAADPGASSAEPSPERPSPAGAGTSRRAGKSR